MALKHKRARRRAPRTPDTATVIRRELQRLRDGRSRSRYEVLGEVADGGMGLILRVRDRVLQRPLAMKVLKPDAGSDGADGQEAVARFFTEAQVAGRLQHPGIVPIHDLGLDGKDRVYFTMPLIKGRELSRVFDLARAGSQGWSIMRALSALAEVCEVVAYAHAHGVIHRDLKPANVLIGASGEIFVVDWGLAKVVARGAQARAVVGSVSGTPLYMAPEQAEGPGAEVTFRTDVYGIGAMLYRLLAGRAPYAPRRGREEAAKTLELIRRGPPTPLARIAPDAPPELVAICEKAMARRPEDRYARIEELARDLQAQIGPLGRRARGGLWAQARRLVRRP